MHLDSRDGCSIPFVSNYSFKTNAFAILKIVKLKFIFK